AVKWARRGDPPGGTPNPQQRPYRFLVCWFASYLVFFSFAATKLPNYLLPLYPAPALLTPPVLGRSRAAGVALPRWLRSAGAAGMLVVAAAVGGGLLLAGGVIPVLPKSARVFPGLEKWAVLGLVPLVGAGLMAYFLRRGDRHGYVVSATAAA